MISKVLFKQTKKRSLNFFLLFALSNKRKKNNYSFILLNIKNDTKIILKNIDKDLRKKTI